MTYIANDLIDLLILDHWLDQTNSAPSSVVPYTFTSRDGVLGFKSEIFHLFRDVFHWIINLISLCPCFIVPTCFFSSNYHFYKAHCLFAVSTASLFEQCYVAIPVFRFVCALFSWLGSGMIVFGYLTNFPYFKLFPLMMDRISCSSSKWNVKKITSWLPKCVAHFHMRQEIRSLCFFFLQYIHYEKVRVPSTWCEHHCSLHD